MGFSLEGFFVELSEIIDSANLDAQEKVDALAAVVASGYQYAIDCGQV